MEPIRLAGVEPTEPLTEVSSRFMPPEGGVPEIAGGVSAAADRPQLPNPIPRFEEPVK